MDGDRTCEDAVETDRDRHFRDRRHSEDGVGDSYRDGAGDKLVNI